MPQWNNGKTVRAFSTSTEMGVTKRDEAPPCLTVPRYPKFLKRERESVYAPTFSLVDLSLCVSVIAKDTTRSFRALLICLISTFCPKVHGLIFGRLSNRLRGCVHSATRVLMRSNKKAWLTVCVPIHPRVVHWG